ncbi:hypothetical protein EDC96DRAFT_587976 [Choanephora cucurbitarum]|nr:hypothetical protein EDC96DRAFT_587976 [Choanephora cucurbitarum]
MHPKNIYNKEPDFGQLAKEFPSFKPYVQTDSKGRYYIDFKNALAVKELCVCLLKKDFHLQVDFPLDTLCPTIPNRLNYILWLEDLMHDTWPKDQPIHGIDIGIGASCIYPLLGCATHPDWSFLGTEIEERSLESAKANVERNQLTDRIKLHHTLDPKRIFPDLNPSISYAFCMCNPPFYRDQKEIEEGTANKQLEPSAVCTGATHEMVTEGGEAGFIGRMILESLVLKKKIRWYTSMIGLKRTLRPLIRLLHDHGITNYTVTRFDQGKTVRWALGWSFYPEPPQTAYQLSAWRPVYQFETQLPKPSLFVIESLIAILEDLTIEYEPHKEEEDESYWMATCTATTNTWSRQARRMMKKKQKITTTLEQPFVTKASVRYAG